MIKIIDFFPTSVREQWQAAKNKSRLDDPPPPSSLADILYRSSVSAQDAFKRSTAEAVLDTGEGKSFQREATRITINQYLQNPVLIGVVLLIVFFFVTRR